MNDDKYKYLGGLLCEAMNLGYTLEVDDYFNITLKKNDRNKFVSKSALLSLLIELGFEDRARWMAKEYFGIELNRSTKPSKEHSTKIKEIISRATR